MIRVVLDSKVYISALLFGGNPRAILEQGKLGAFELFISAPLIQETEEVLKTKFGWPDARIRRAGTITWRAAHVVTPEIQVDDCADSDDNRVLECALSSGADFIVTGDRGISCA